jgi:ABC-type dipeptide/oligopeptide/nickel transport system permease component
LRFILRRLLTLIATLLVASFVIYGSLYLAPGSPIATLTGSRTPPPDVTATLNARYHLKDPFLKRYTLWLKDTAQTRGARVAATAQGHTCRLRFVPFWAGYLLASNRA